MPLTSYSQDIEPLVKFMFCDINNKYKDDIQHKIIKVIYYNHILSYKSIESIPTHPHRSNKCSLSIVRYCEIVCFDNKIIKIIFDYICQHYQYLDDGFSGWVHGSNTYAQYIEHQDLLLPLSYNFRMKCSDVKFLFI
jgi:hypothetical protein